MRPVRVSVSAAANSQPIPLDQYISPFNVGWSVDLSLGASLTYRIQHTFEDVFAPGWSPATAVWYDNSAFAGPTNKSVSYDGNYAFPVSAIRLVVATYTSGTATLNVLQAGITT